jgi:hypothetical protein
MAYAPFHEKFPKIAEKETRSFSAPGNAKLAGDEFGLLEMYCDEPDCDCRRVMFCVLSQRQQKPVAYIAYGWGSAQFYAKWFGKHNPEITAEMQGPVLNTMSPQSELAPDLLAVVRGILADPVYAARLKRHYMLFRQAVAEKTAVTPKGSRAVRKAKSKRRKK